MPGWRALPYSIEALRRLMAGPFADTERVIRDSVHDAYFEEYFGALHAKSILVEDEYTDHDFLEDFAAYYVRCFADYKRR